MQNDSSVNAINKLDNISNERVAEEPNLHKDRDGKNSHKKASKSRHSQRSHKDDVKAEAPDDKSKRRRNAAQDTGDNPSKRSQDDAKPTGRVRKNRGFLEQKATRQKHKSEKRSEHNKRNVAHPYVRNSRSQNSRNHKGQKTAVYGALDLGTNNCRLLLARPQRKGFRVIDSFSRIIRLGEGLSKNSKLSDEAMDRTIDALKVCSEKMAYRGVHKSRLIATEACRRAENGAEFIHRVHAETGLKLEIIEQQTEAKLAVAGCAALLDERSKYAVVFDIGGGSSELILVEISPDDNADAEHKIEESPFHPNYRIVDWTSLPIGVVTLSEKFGGTNVTHKLMDQMIEYVDAFLAPFEEKHQISKKINKEKIHLLGTSGTVTTVAGIHLKLKQYDRRRIDGFWLESSVSLGVTDMLIDMEFEGRAKHPCIGIERADLVLAGCAIFNAIYRRWPAERTRVADRGLREGILTNLMSGDLADNNKIE
ncbi:MAG: Ppx/GppA family phosphatase [Alphaproteobacteria bacterium]|nr:Ppx/GppA family phosphatase [Alphaproteobacteria bacterium]